MVSSSEEVRTRSEPVIRALTALENVRGIVCYGSYAVGTFDERSDIDLYVICDPHIEASQSRSECFGRIDGVEDLEIDHSEAGWSNEWNPVMDRLRVNGMTFDIVYNTVTWTRAVVRGVTERGATSLDELHFRPYCMLGLLDNCIVWYDPDLILQELIAKLYPYPVKLMVDLLTQSRAELAGFFADLKDFAERDIGSTALHFLLCRILDTMGTMLYALNERYSTGTKRVEIAYRGLSVTPGDFLQRYERILETPLTPEGRRQTVQDIGSLIDELDSLAGDALSRT